MRHFERAIVYVGLATAIGLSLGWNGIGADAVAQGSAQAQPVRIATADILNVVERLFISDRYRPAREASVQAANKKLEPMLATRAEIENMARALPPESPERKALEERYYANEQALQQAQQAEQNQIEMANTQQLTEAYRLVVEKAQALAKSMGYSHVVSTKLDPTGIRSTSVPGAVQEMLGRPVVLADPADDLTDRLLKEFGLENVALPTPDVQAPAAMPTPTPAAEPAAEQPPAATPK